MTFQDFCDLLLLFLLTSVEKKFVIVLCTFIVSGFVMSIILFINNIWNYKKGKKTKNRVIIFGIIALFCGVPTVYISAMSLEMYSYYQVNGDFYYKIWYEFYNDDSVDFDLVLQL